MTGRSWERNDVRMYINPRLTAIDIRENRRREKPKANGGRNRPSTPEAYRSGESLKAEVGSETPFPAGHSQTHFSLPLCSCIPDISAVETLLSSAHLSVSRSVLPLRLIRMRRGLYLALVNRRPAGPVVKSLHRVPQPGARSHRGNETGID